jgi:hypothetical protein
MKITSFNPQIITKDAEAVVRLFEALGFERRHIKEDIGDLSVTGIRMKDENGFYLDISESDQLPVDCIEAIRMNVDNFDEAYRLLEDHGFKNFYGDGTVATKSSKSALMISPSGFAINLIQHIKDHE